MRVIDLDGNESKWKLKSCKVYTEKFHSSYHIQVKQLLKEVLPTAQILEEIPIQIYPRQTLYLDFYIPIYKWAIEIHGEQHFKFIRHFHQTPLGFLAHKKRDREKELWCRINSIHLITLNYNEDINVWRKKLS